MKTKLLPLLVLLSSLCIFNSAQSQVVLTIDWSDLSAVKFTATSTNSAINYSNEWSFEEGIALINFFTGTVNGQDIGSSDLGNLVTNTLSDSFASGAYFDIVSSWNDVTGPSNSSASGIDLTLWSSDSTKMTFSTSSAAFTGEAVFNLSAYATFTNLFPANGTTGELRIWDNNGTIGQWQVVGASTVPEPSTYAALAGAIALLGTVGMRLRRRKHLNA